MPTYYIIMQEPVISMWSRKNHDKQNAFRHSTWIVVGNGRQKRKYSSHSLAGQKHGSRAHEQGLGAIHGTCHG